MGMNADFTRKETYQIHDLLCIMEMLRAEDGCPWDREQNHHTIRNNFIEETYEVVEAIDNEDSELLREELGDVLLQVVFHSQMECELDRFNFEDVCDGICKKLIHRHPHIFGDVIASNADEVLRNWDAIKKLEKHQKTAVSTLEAVSRALPALIRSCKVQKRAAKSGFDYFKEPECSSVQSALSELKSEIKELEEAIASGRAGDISDELGDLLFSAVNVSRILKNDPEEALCCSTDKFIRRFSVAEGLAAERGVQLERCTPQELDVLWKEAKKKDLKNLEVHYDKGRTGECGGR